LHRDSGRWSLLGIAIVFFEAAPWRLRWATGEVVEAVSVPSLRRRIVAVGQVIGRLPVATVEARHGRWSLVVAARVMSWSWSGAG
jgi:hypothetical protein